MGEISSLQIVYRSRTINANFCDVNSDVYAFLTLPELVKATLRDQLCEPLYYNYSVVAVELYARTV